LSAYFALVQIWSAIIVAAVLGAINFAIAAILFVVAGRPPSGRDPPVGALVPLALRAVRKGGALCAPAFTCPTFRRSPYHILWGERQIMSVANLTRKDGIDFLAAAAEANIQTHTTVISARPSR
jgi:hypothetical protein